jgi:hypothetical protein
MIPKKYFDFGPNSPGRGRQNNRKPSRSETHRDPGIPVNGYTRIPVLGIRKNKGSFSKEAPCARPDKNTGGGPKNLHKCYW